MVALRFVSWMLPLAAAMSAREPEVIRQYLEHPSFSWKCARSAHFQFCFEPKLEADPNLASARDGAEAARSQVLRAARASAYEPRIYVFFLESRDRMKELIGFDGEGRSRPVQHAIFFVPTPVRPSLTHELTHEIVSNLWGAAEQWIEEGLASYVAEPGVIHMTCRSMLARGAMIPLVKLVNAEWDPSVYSPDVTYVELAGFVEYLHKAYGAERVRQVWQGGSAAIPQILAKSVPELERDWLAALSREQNRVQ